tara:strand:+ start:361 stop:1290 length:930 start_codon:yes stop_codon:yes gene_type:complete
MAEDQYKEMINDIDNPVADQIKANGLGKASMSRFNNDTLDADIHLGWISVDLTALPSMGRFYPADADLKIRSAKVAEIRHFSTIDETNLIDIEEKLNSIVKACTRFKSGTKMMSYKDILEEDRIYVLLAIRDLSFPEAENKLMLEAQDSSGNEFKVELSSKYFDVEKISEQIQPYYSEEARSFVIQTKSAGEVTMCPPSIGVMEEITKFMQGRQTERKTWDQSFLQILPYITLDWRGFNAKKIFENEIEFQSWSEKKYMVIYRLAEQMKIGIKPELVVEHEGEEVFVPLNFPGGIKSLFIISDLTSELL